MGIKSWSLTKALKAAVIFISVPQYLRVVFLVDQKFAPLYSLVQIITSTK